MLPGKDLLHLAQTVAEQNLARLWRHETKGRARSAQRSDRSTEQEQVAERSGTNQQNA